MSRKEQRHRAAVSLPRKGRAADANSPHGDGRWARICISRTEVQTALPAVVRTISRGSREAAKTTAATLTGLGSAASPAPTSNTAISLSSGGVKTASRTRADKRGRDNDDARVDGERVETSEPPNVSVTSTHARRLNGGGTDRSREMTAQSEADAPRSRIDDDVGMVADDNDDGGSSTTRPRVGQPRSRRVSSSPAPFLSPDRSHPAWQPSNTRRVGRARSQAVLESAMRAASGRGELQRSVALPASVGIVPAPEITAVPVTSVPAVSAENSSHPPAPALRTQTCGQEGCPRRPSFGKPGDKRATRCAGHKLEGQVDITSRRCAQPGCSLIPSFRHAGQGSQKFCAAHKEPGMRDYHSQTRKCMHPDGCERTPSFGFEGCKRTACAQHRVEGMVNRNIRCGSENCRLVPAFGLRGEGPSFCAKHKQVGMVNVVSRRCQHSSCDRIPSYGKEGDGRKASFCKEHKSEDMVNVKHPRCAQPDCRRQPGFGPAGTKTAVYCKEHKAPGMVDVKNNYARKRARRAE